MKNKAIRVPKRMRGHLLLGFIASLLTSSKACAYCLPSFKSAELSGSSNYFNALAPGIVLDQDFPDNHLFSDSSGGNLPDISHRGLLDTPI